MLWKVLSTILLFIGIWRVCDLEEYTLTLDLKVVIQAPSLGDAYDVAMDTFGKGSFPGAEVIEYEVLDDVGPK